MFDEWQNKSQYKWNIKDRSTDKGLCVKQFISNINIDRLYDDFLFK